MTKKYVATRKDVCAGQLSKNIDMSYKILDKNNNEVSEQQLADQGIFNFSAACELVCRGMLFNVNDDGLTNDLIYTTPTNYSIEGIQPKIEVVSDFSIKSYTELEPLLEYEGFGIDLTQSDLNRIFRKYIANDRWLRHNMELFGWKELSPDIYGVGGFQILPMELYKKLSAISCVNNGKPNSVEPGYSMIKKKKFF